MEGEGWRLRAMYRDRRIEGRGGETEMEGEGGSQWMRMMHGESSDNQGRSSHCSSWFMIDGETVQGCST